MNLQPLYDVKGRLEYAAIAGTGLLSEDFRLKRAAENLKPLAAASPVFGKIDAGLAKLLSAPAEARSGLLLDTLALVDAVAYTQAKTGIDGELTPLPTGGGRYYRLSYGQLLPLLTALTSAGGGRMEIVQSRWESCPAYFEDYRVLPAVVAGLGDSYGELAELNAKILKRVGMSALPLLKKGFDPAGNKAMARRVEVVAAIAGAGENDFYLSQLPKAKKDIRSALILALGLCEENGELLIELCRTEKGASQKAAHWALAKLEYLPAWDYWSVLAIDEPGRTAEYMTNSTTAEASRIVARCLDKCLSPYEADPNSPISQTDMELLQGQLFALPGKSGPEICDLYRRMAALGNALDNKCYEGPAGRSMAVRFRYTPWGVPNQSCKFSEVMPRVLWAAIQFHPAPDLMSLAEELDKTASGDFAAPVILTALLTKSAEEVYRLIQPLFHPPVSIFKKPEKRRLEELKVLSLGRLTGVDGQVFLTRGWADETRGNVCYCSDTIPIKEPLDRRIYEELLEQSDRENDRIMFRLIPAIRDSQLLDYLSKMLFSHAKYYDVRPDEYISVLEQCGRTDFRGLITAFCKRRRVSSADVLFYLDRIPGPVEYVIQEAEEIVDMIQRKEIQTGYWNQEQVKLWLERKRQQIASSGGIT